MGKYTDIEWCDSTVNGQMGCDGCELYNPRNPDEATCYAKWLTDLRAGLKGWPVAFNQPALFPERILAACKWKDLTGTERVDKPWLNGMPRLIFLNDMGDTFTESLPIDWLAPFIPAMEVAPHIWILLTKRPARMRALFNQLGYVPANFWLLTSVTSEANIGRIDFLLDIGKIKGASVLGVSVEPLLEPVDLLGRFMSGDDPGRCRCGHSHGFTRCPNTGGVAQACHRCECSSFRRVTGLQWVIVGYESGTRARPGHPAWACKLRDDCLAAGVPFFFKQHGEYIKPERFSDSDGDYYYYGRGGELLRCSKQLASPYKFEDHTTVIRVGKHAAGRTLDGRTWDEFPAWR